MHWIFGERFEELLAAWRYHHETRYSGAPYEQLVAARHRLDEAREGVYRIRRALAPTDDEQGDAALTIVCPTMEAAVSIPWQDVTREADLLHYRCVCGSSGSTGIQSRSVQPSGEAPR